MISNQLFVTLYTLSIYRSVHQQLIQSPLFRLPWYLHIQLANSCDSPVAWFVRAASPNRSSRIMVETTLNWGSKYLLIYLIFSHYFYCIRKRTSSVYPIAKIIIETSFKYINICMKRANLSVLGSGSFMKNWKYF